MVIKSLRRLSFLSFAASGFLCAGVVLAHVPESGDGSHPAGRPVGGPIKPQAAPIGAGGGSGGGKGSDYILNPVAKVSSLRMIGGVLPVARTQAIFWGPQWQEAPFAGDEIDGLDNFYKGLNGSGYLEALTEYMPFASVASTNGVRQPTTDVDLPRPVPLPYPVFLKARPQINYQGYVLDPSPVPALGNVPPEGTDLMTAAAEVCSLVERGVIVPKLDRMNYYPVYVTEGRPANISSCAAHGYAYFGQYFCSSTGLPQTAPSFATAIFYRMDGDPLCDVDDKVTGHSPGLAALANLSARAMAEVQTDPRFAGWYDSAGNEVDEKCDSIFIAPFVTLSNGSNWKLQALWSNAAFTGGTGVPNVDGMPGCIDSLAVSSGTGGKGGKGGAVKGNVGVPPANFPHY